MNEPEQALYNKILTCDYDFEDEVWEDISEEAKDFISKLLEPNRSKRLKPEEAIKHKWITKYAPDKDLDVTILDQLRYCTKLTEFQRQIM